MPVRSQPPAQFNVAENVASDSNGIVFLHLRLAADGTLTLLDTQTRPGILKPGDADAHGRTLRCQVLSTSGAVLWAASVEDPSSQRVEWADPAQPGHILSRVVETPGAELMVRVPRFAQQQRVEFRRPAAGADVAHGAAHSTATGSVATDRLIGAFNLTLP